MIETEAPSAMPPLPGGFAPAAAVTPNRGAAAAPARTGAATSVAGTAAGLPLEVAAKLYRSLGDPTRLRLLLSLVEGERRVVDLVGDVGLAQSTVSAHLACLRDCGLLAVRPEGRQSFYRLAHDVRDLLVATEALLGRTGVHVELCPTYEPARPT